MISLSILFDKPIEIKHKIIKIRKKGELLSYIQKKRKELKYIIDDFSFDVTAR